MPPAFGSRAIALPRQHPPDLMHPPRHGRFGDPQNLRSLGMGKLLAGDEHGRIAVRRLEPGERAFEPDRIIQVAAIRRPRQTREDRKPLGKTAERPAAPSMVTTGVEDDAAQPGGEFGIAPKAGNLLDQSTADILSDIVGIGARSGQLPGKAMDPVIVPLQQRAESVAIPLGRGGEQRMIRIVPDIRPDACHAAAPAAPRAATWKSRTPSDQTVAASTTAALCIIHTEDAMEMAVHTRIG